MPDPPRGPAEEGILYRKAGAPARRRPVPSVEGGLLQAASGTVTASDAALDRQVIDAVNEAAALSPGVCGSAPTAAFPGLRGAGSVTGPAACGG